ncbi:hypothetical protein JHK85_058095 [Glycine max]|nr:hypothetical protein JHK85_058095 [Glycine max]
MLVELFVFLDSLLPMHGYLDISQVVNVLLVGSHVVIFMHQLDLVDGLMQSSLTHALTTVRHVNKTDVVTLGTTFGSLCNIMGASMEDLARCPGIGERKVKRLFDTFHEPFKHVESSRQAIPETSVQNKPATFAKYSGRVGKRKSTSQVEEKGESIISKESEAET